LSKGLNERVMALLAEAKRRRVFRTAGVYLVAVWGLSQGAVELAPLFGAPDWIVRAGVIAAVALLPGVVVLAWMFDIGRSGIVRDPHDAATLEDRDGDIANMSTIIGGETGQGAVIVRWRHGEEPKSVIFTEDFLIGRGSDCRVRFYDPLVSRKHARIYHAEGEWHVEDLGSRNGTLVDEHPIERVALPSACEMRVNEAGPALRIERVAPGASMQTAMSEFPPGPMVAHVRNHSSGVSRDPRAASRSGSRSR